MTRNWIVQLGCDLEAPLAVRRFGSGWFAGFFALVLALAGLCLVSALRWPDWFATPQLGKLEGGTGFRVAVHVGHVNGADRPPPALARYLQRGAGRVNLVTASHIQDTMWFAPGASPSIRTELFSFSPGR